MRFSIITPSFRNSEWLKLCVASVADQQVDLEHIVQDAGSDDGTLDWLLTDSRVKAFVEKDSGMYDGINRGLRKATGEIVAYLNCDEQYLPGALSAVKEMFEGALPPVHAGQNPEGGDDPNESDETGGSAFAGTRRCRSVCGSLRQRQ